MMAHLLSGAEGVLSISEPFLQYAVVPHWMLRRFYYEFQKSAGLCCLRPPREGDNARFGRFLRKMALLNGFGFLLVKETYHEQSTSPCWNNAELLTRLVSSGMPVIATIRDPFDTVASMVRLCRWLVGVTGRLLRLRWPVLERYRTRTEIVSWAADNWVRYCDWAQRHNLRLLRYEDVVNEPETHLRRICQHTGLPFHPRMLNHRDRRQTFGGGIGDVGLLKLGPRPISTKSIGRRHELTPDQQQIVRQTCAAHAARLEYSL